VKTGGQHPVKDDNSKKLEKEKKLKEQKEMALLFRSVQTQKVEKGLDLDTKKLLRYLKKYFRDRSKVCGMFFL
jgi:hypothetical protein